MRDVMTDETVSHYRILESLAEWPTGGLYKAEDLENGLQVALRVLPPGLGREERKRLIQFATVASELAHPNIEELLEIGETEDGAIFWSSELRPAETLERLIGRGALPPKEALAIALQVAAGLEQAHRAGIIHGALRCEHVKVFDSRAEVSGFGLFIVGGKGLSVRIGDPLVALAYRSPEQVRGDPISRRADIWSLGVILYEMIAGRRPFCGSTTGALAEEILGSAQAPLSAAHGTPAALDRVLAQALAKDARRRYPAVGELVRELQAIAPRIGDSAAPARAKRKPSKRKAPRRAPAKPRKAPAKTPRKAPRGGGARGAAGDAGRSDEEAEVTGETASSGEAAGADDAVSTGDARSVEGSGDVESPRDAASNGSTGDVESAGGAAQSPGDAAGGAEAVASSASPSRTGILFAGLGALLLAALLWILSRGF